MTRVNYIIEGLNNDPEIDYRFKRTDYVDDPIKWQRLKDDTTRKELYEYLYGINDNCPCGDRIIVERGGYLYLYLIDSIGDYEPLAYGKKSILEG